LLIFIILETVVLQFLGKAQFSCEGNAIYLEAFTLKVTEI